MARDESDREDLMREATALAERVELDVVGEAEHVIAGFRRSGHLSIYFGPDPVFHFDEWGRLRRSFLDDCLYRTQGHTLAQLTRHRTENATELRRYDLKPDELDEFFRAMKKKLARLYDAISNGHATIIQQVPENTEILAKLQNRVANIVETNDSLAPAIPGKR